MSPRKSSTSSAEPVRRPRYLALEVAGTFPSGGRWLEPALWGQIPEAERTTFRFRLIRLDGVRALVEVGHLSARTARRAWNGPVQGPDGRTVRVATRRTYGTLRKGKAWLRESAAEDRPPTPA